MTTLKTLILALLLAFTSANAVDYDEIMIFPREFGHGVKLLSQIASVSDAR